MKILRQGDVLLVRVKALPTAATEVAADRGRIILAHGEATGHAHAIVVDRERPQARLWSAEAERFLHAVEASVLTHEEHAPVEIDPGVYRVVIQTEYTPQELRRVQD